MKLPNGYGSVYKLSGRRRKPWAVRKTTGWTESTETKTSQPIYAFIGYYATRAEALTALSDYNKDPYDIRAASITFAEVYDKWAERKFTEKGISGSSVKSYKAAYLVCSKLYNMKFADIKLVHLQDAIDSSGKNHPTLRKVKVLLNQVFEYAVKYEVITPDRDISNYVDISQAGNPNALDRKPFSKTEIKKLWEWSNNNDHAGTVLMLIYSGVRIDELLSLKKANVNIAEKWFDVINSKTEAGIRRVPIADRTMPFFQSWINLNSCSYLISTPDGHQMTYDNFRDSHWDQLMLAMSMKHLPHDTRHTCISLLTVAGVDERLIKKIVGHKGQGVTQRVYTHIDIEEMLIAINKI